MKHLLPVTKPFHTPLPPRLLPNTDCTCRLFTESSTPLRLTRPNQPTLSPKRLISRSPLEILIIRRLDSIYFSVPTLGWLKPPNSETCFSLLTLRLSRPLNGPTNPAFSLDEMNLFWMKWSLIKTWDLWIMMQDGEFYASESLLYRATEMFIKRYYVCGIHDSG